MADAKISALTALGTGGTGATAADVLPIVDTSGSATKKITITNLREVSQRGIMTDAITIVRPTANKSAKGNLGTWYISSNTAWGAPLAWNASGQLINADASSTAAMPAVAMSLTSATGADMPVAFSNSIVRNDAWGFTAPKQLYTSITAGVMTHATVSSTGEYSQVLGEAITSTLVNFTPAKVMGEHL